MLALTFLWMLVGKLLVPYYRQPVLSKVKSAKKALRSVGALSANNARDLLKKGAKGEKNTNIYIESKTNNYKYE